MSQTGRLNDSYAAAEQAEADAEFRSSNVNPIFANILSAHFPPLRTARAEPVRREREGGWPWDEPKGSAR